MPKGCFTISLDFELHWGVFDKRDRKMREPVYRNTLALIPRMLDLFAEHEIGVTWATVGSLFCANREEWYASQPEHLPQYVQEKYSPYVFAEQHGLGDDVHWAHFAPEMVKRIAGYAGQELATHTFSHYYCLEQGQTLEAFSADLAVVQKLALELTGATLKSLVFPRNQFNHDYMAVCHQHGIQIIRSNPNVWFWTGIGNDDTTLLRRLFRTGDVFVPTGPRSSYAAAAITIKEDEPIALPASRLLRQYDDRYSFTNAIRISRIKSEMTKAARLGEYYHLWWHPENFGATPEACMLELSQLVQHYTWLRNEYGMHSKTMGQIATTFMEGAIRS